MIHINICLNALYTDGSLVNIESLETQQLALAKKQLDDEVEHLSASFTQLRDAQSKFKECLIAITPGLNTQLGARPLFDFFLANQINLISIESAILVPLTNSLYCRGQYKPTTRLLVDIGTGFFVEKVLLNL